MGALRGVMFRHSARAARAAVIGSIAVAATITLATTAVAATTIGSVATVPPTPCGPGADIVQLASSPVSYAVPPGDGSITSWSIQADSGVEPVALLLWRPTAVAGSYMLVGASPSVPLGLPGQLNTFPLATPIPAQANDVLGLRPGGSIGCGVSGAAGDVEGYVKGTTPSWATVPMTPQGSFLLNVQATVCTVAPPPPPPPTPTTKEDCKDGGWQHLVDANGQPFPDQGACVSSVALAGGDTSNGDNSQSQDKRQSQDSSQSQDNQTQLDSSQSQSDNSQSQGDTSQAGPDASQSRSNN